jgi:hypothetical protein
LLISLLLFMHYMFKGDLLCFFDFYDLLTFLEWLIVMFNHTKVSNNDVHAFRCIPCWQSRVAVQSAKHSGQQHLRFICSHFREIIYVEALLPRPHMPGQICPRACFKEGNQSHRSLNLNETNVICLILQWPTCLDSRSWGVLRHLIFIFLINNRIPLPCWLGNSQAAKPYFTPFWICSRRHTWTRARTLAALEACRFGKVTEPLCRHPYPNHRRHSVKPPFFFCFALLPRTLCVVLHSTCPGVCLNI